MKIWRVVPLLILSAAAVGKDKTPADFPLAVHIREVRMETATNGVSGGAVSTDPTTGAVSGGNVSGGDSYNWHLMIADIDGHTYGLRVLGKISHKREALIIGTLGWGAIGTKPSTTWLHIGDYKGRWLKGGNALEVEYTDADGKPRTEELSVVSEQ